MFKQETTILSLLSITYALLGYFTEQPTIQSLGVMGWLGLFQLIYCIRNWVKFGNQLISPYIIFLISLYIFSYGQSFLWALGLESERSLIDFHGITIPEIFEAQIITLIMLAFFHIGASHYVHNNKNKRVITHLKPINYTTKLKQIGWFLFIVSVIPYLNDTINDMFLSMSKGYGALYEGEGKVGLDNLSGFISGYFIPSVICLFIAYKENRIIRTFFISIIILNIIAILLTGGRTNAVILMSILIILYNYLIKKFTKKWLIIGVCGIFILLQILAIVAKTRVDRGHSASIEQMKFDNNAAVDAIAEMGGTMFCLIKSMEIVPQRESYRYGKSYAYSFTTLIPNLGFWDIHPAKKESNLSDWLTDKLNLGYGTGFSMCAEAYVNFGYLGFIAFFFWGWFLASIFGKIEISAQTKNYALMAFLLILFWYFLKLPRNNFINLIRPIFFVAGPIYLFCTKTKK